jgi:hypothetical protein
MKPEQQIKALAGLDGWKSVRKEDGWWNISPAGHHHPALCDSTHGYPDYLTSYDAIIPVIEKHLRNGGYGDSHTIDAFDSTFGSPCIWQDILTATPAQLCEALLRATGKWEE